MHDKNGTPIKKGDIVILEGVFGPTGNPDSTYCNGQVDIPQMPGTGMTACVSINAKHCELRALPPEDVRADKILRQRIDAEIQNLKALTPSRERALAITKLQEAVMWLGMDLKRLGTPNPYPNSKDPSNTIVDPTADGLRL